MTLDEQWLKQIRQVCQELDESKSFLLNATDDTAWRDVRKHQRRAEHHSALLRQHASQWILRLLDERQAREANE